MSLLNRRADPCYEFTRSPKDGKKRCPQCWKVKQHPEEFKGKRGRPIQICLTCSSHRAQYLKKYREEHPE